MVLAATARNLHPVFHADALLLQQLEVGLVYERRRRQGVAVALAPQPRVGNHPQLAVEQWDQTVEGLSVALP
jgi:hypothetical protein